MLIVFLLEKKLRYSSCIFCKSTLTSRGLFAKTDIQLVIVDKHAQRGVLERETCTICSAAAGHITDAHPGSAPLEGARRAREAGITIQLQLFAF